MSKTIHWDCPGCGQEGNVEADTSEEAWAELRELEEEHKPHLGYQRTVTTQAIK